MHTPSRPRVAIFSPNPMVSIAIESFSAEGGDDIHIHPAGQGVWVARMAAELGAEPVLCGFIGGEGGTVLRPLLGEMPVEPRVAHPSGGRVEKRRGPGGVGSFGPSRAAPPPPPAAAASASRSPRARRC